MQFSPLPCHLVPLRSKYPPQTIFTNTFSLRFSLNMSDQISHQQETTCKIIVLYVIIFIFLNSKLRDKNILLRMTASIP